MFPCVDQCTRCWAFGRLYLLAVVNHAARHMHRFLCGHVLSLLLGGHPGENRWVRFNCVLVTARLFSTAVAPLYVPTSSAGGFRLLHVLTSPVDCPFAYGRPRGGRWVPPLFTGAPPVHLAPSPDAQLLCFAQFMLP